MTDKEAAPKKAQKSTGQAVLNVAKKEGSDGDGIIKLSTGYRARLHPVASSLIADVTAQLDEPQIPVFMNEDKGREEPNPNDPAYIKAMAEYQRKQGQAGLDAMVMFGVELVDGVPPKEEWLPKLQFMERRKSLDLSDYDLDNEMDLEYIFKKYIAVGNADYERITELSGVSEADIDEAVRKFQGDEARGAD